MRATLTTRVNRPRVRMRCGSASRLTAGLTYALTKPMTGPNTVNHHQSPVNDSPGTNSTVTHAAIALPPILSSSPTRAAYGDSCFLQTPRPGTISCPQALHRKCDAGLEDLQASAQRAGTAE